MCRRTSQNDKSLLKNVETKRTLEGALRRRGMFYALREDGGEDKASWME
jgi:hypothetical protein